VFSRRDGGLPRGKAHFPATVRVIASVDIGAAHTAACALFRLGTNRLLKISGRCLRERTTKERERERERVRKADGEEGKRDHTLHQVFVHLCGMRRSHRIRFPLPGRRTS